MIVTDGRLTGRVAPPGAAEIRWVCLARRGMLHSECDAVDLWELAPSATVTGRGRDGQAEAWFVVSGKGILASGREVSAGDLILRPPAVAGEILRAVTALRILMLSVLADDTARMLPARAPSLPHEN